MSDVLKMAGVAAVADGERYPLALVEWLDSRAHSIGWRPIDEIVEEENDSCHCFSVGWLLQDGKGKLILTSHLAGLEGNDRRVDGASGFTIPRGCVVKITRLHGKR